MKNNKEREREREGTIGKNRKDSISWQRREEKSHRETFPPPFFSSLSFHSKEAGVALIPSVGWGEILDSCWCELWLRISSLARGFYEWITRGSPPLPPSPSNHPLSLFRIVRFSPPDWKTNVERLSRWTTFDRTIDLKSGWSIRDWRFWSRVYINDPTIADRSIRNREMDGFDDGMAPLLD